MSLFNLAKVFVSEYRQVLGLGLVMALTNMETLFRLDQFTQIGMDSSYQII